jgi:hypothetical protein
VTVCQTLLKAKEQTGNILEYAQDKYLKTNNLKVPPEDLF